MCIGDSVWACVAVWDDDQVVTPSSTLGALRGTQSKQDMAQQVPGADQSFLCYFPNVFLQGSVRLYPVFHSVPSERLVIDLDGVLVSSFVFFRFIFVFGSTQPPGESIKVFLTSGSADLGLRLNHQSNS